MNSLCIKRKCRCDKVNRLTNTRSMLKDLNAVSTLWPACFSLGLLSEEEGNVPLTLLVSFSLSPQAGSHGLSPLGICHTPVYYFLHSRHCRSSSPSSFLWASLLWLQLMAELPLSLPLGKYNSNQKTPCKKKLPPPSYFRPQIPQPPPLHHFVNPWRTSSPSV